MHSIHHECDLQNNLTNTVAVVFCVAMFLYLGKKKKQSGSGKIVMIPQDFFIPLLQG